MAMIKVDPRQKPLVSSSPGKTTFNPDGLRLAFPEPKRVLGDKEKIEFAWKAYRRRMVMSHGALEIDTKMRSFPNEAQELQRASPIDYMRLVTLERQFADLKIDRITQEIQRLGEGETIGIEKAEEILGTAEEHANRIKTAWGGTITPILSQLDPELRSEEKGIKKSQDIKEIKQGLFFQSHLVFHCLQDFMCTVLGETPKPIPGKASVEAVIENFMPRFTGKSYKSGGMIIEDPGRVAENIVFTQDIGRVMHLLEDLEGNAGEAVVARAGEESEAKGDEFSYEDFYKGKQRITLDFDDEHGELILKYRDFGIGMTPDELGNFRKKVKGEGFTGYSEKGERRGIGGDTIAANVKALGGSIDVKSERFNGKNGGSCGTEVTLRIPAEKKTV
ncbi:MAG: ATP-binding protein [Candidatus Altiarchaeota archaeon]